MIGFWLIFQFSLYSLVSKQQGSNATHCCTPVASLTEAGALPARKGGLCQTLCIWTKDSLRDCECGGFHKNIYLKILSNNASPKAAERQWNIVHVSDEILTQQEGWLQEKVLLVKYGPVSAVMRASQDVSSSSAGYATGPTAPRRLTKALSGCDTLYRTSAWQPFRITQY